MGLRYRQTIKIADGVKINVGKKGISTSIGKPGSTVNISKHGIRNTVGIPGAGISYSSYSPWKRKTKRSGDVTSLVRHGAVGTYSRSGGYNCEAGYISPEAVEASRNHEWCEKGRALAWCLSIFGIFGAHRYYVDKVGTGLLYTFTFGFGMIGWLIDLIKILSGTFTDADGFPLLDKDSQNDLPFIPQIEEREFSTIRFGFYVAFYAVLCYFTFSTLPGILANAGWSSTFQDVAKVALIPTFFSGIYLFCRRKLKDGEQPSAAPTQTVELTEEQGKEVRWWSNVGKWGLFATISLSILLIGAVGSHRADIAMGIVFFGCIALIITVNGFLRSHELAKNGTCVAQDAQSVGYCPPSPFVDDPCFGTSVPEWREADNAYQSLFYKYKNDIRRKNWLTTMISKEYRESEQDEHKNNQIISWCREEIEIIPRLNEYLSERKKLGEKYSDNADCCEPLDGSLLYRRIAIIFEKQGKYDDAIQACKDSIASGWADDRTRDGFEGRIKRIETLKAKKMKENNEVN